MMLPSKELVPLLHLILTLLSIHGTASNMPKTETWSPPLVPAPTSTCPIGPIITTLRDDHSLPGAFIRPVLNLFGEIIGEQWEGRLSDMVTAAGLGVLEGLPGKGVTLDEFYGDWDEQIGDEWRVLKDLTRLQVSLITPASPWNVLTNPGQLPAGNTGYVAWNGIELDHHPLSSTPALSQSRYAIRRPVLDQA